MKKAHYKSGPYKLNTSLPPYLKSGGLVVFLHQGLINFRLYFDGAL